MKPNEIIAKMELFGTKITRRTLLRYEKEELIPTPYYRDGKTTEYPEVALLEALTAHCLLNKKPVTTPRECSIARKEAQMILYDVGTFLHSKISKLMIEKESHCGLDAKLFKNGVNKLAIDISLNNNVIQYLLKYISFFCIIEFDIFGSDKEDYIKDGTNDFFTKCVNSNENIIAEGKIFYKESVKCDKLLRVAFERLDIKRNKAENRSVVTFNVRMVLDCSNKTANSEKCRNQWIDVEISLLNEVSFLNKYYNPFNDNSKDNVRVDDNFVDDIRFDESHEDFARRQQALFVE